MKPLKRTLMLTVALAIGASMLGLGKWQLDRAEQKQTLLNQVISQSLMPPKVLSKGLVDAAENPEILRFTPVTVTGRYLADKSIFIDNKVLDTRVGYKLMTPLVLASDGSVVLVDRGWISAGVSREVLPPYETSQELLQLSGRLNLPMSKPALWKDSYATNAGAVWQYLPILQYAQQMRLNVLPLVVELAPDQSSETDLNLIRRWNQIDDQWVAKHKGYAFQWFAMASAFFIACLILASRTSKPN